MADTNSNPIINTQQGGTSYITKDANGGYTVQNDAGWTGAGGYLSTGSQVFNAAAAGMNAYTGYQALGLAKDEFDFQKSATNRDIANQGKLINNDIMTANDVGLALAGNTLTSEQQAASTAAAQSRQVDTSAIG